MTSTAGLPGAELVTKGLADLAAGRDSVEARLVAIGAPRLRALGFSVPDSQRPEHALYRLLEHAHGNGAHSAYNALVRRLVSFERAMEGRVARAGR